MIAKGAGIDLGAALSDASRAASSACEEAASLSAERAFATEFGRSLEYYSGLVFQIEVALALDEPIARRRAL